MTKRRYISQLPVIHQTQTLQKFFSSTVDQVFQPGDTQNINAFVGRKPSYFDALQDFYKTEINSERAFYQLEPSMTTSSGGEFTDLLFYQDLVNNLRFQGANTSNHERLFEADQYSWCPPVDVHKLNNFREYYWLPDGPPIMVLNIPSKKHVGDGTKITFSAPTLIPGTIANPQVYVDGVVVPSVYDPVANQVSLGTAPGANSDVVVWVNADFKQQINDKTKYSHAIAVTAYATQTQTVEYTNRKQLVVFKERIIDTPPDLELGMRVEIRDDHGSVIYSVGRQDGKLVLGADKEFNYRAEPLHTVIERTGSSPWSVMNHWYHKSLVFYSDDLYQPHRATRPIIEFIGGSSLFQYPLDTRRLRSVNGLREYVQNPLNLNGHNITRTGAPTLDGKTLEEGRFVVLEPTNGSAESGTLINEIIEIVVRESSGLQKEILEFDSPAIAFDSQGQYVGPNDPTAEWSNYDNVGLEGEYTVYVTKPDTTQTRDVVRDLSVRTSFKDYWFNGQTWADNVQSFSGSYEPLFQLYDKNGVALDDPTVYPSSTFKGSKIFAFKHGEGEADPVLGFPLSRNSFGGIQFTDHINDDYSYAQGTIEGFKFYKIGTEFGNNWNIAGTSKQAIVDGHYEIPTNLQANPLNDQVVTVSANDWNDQFKTILAASPRSWTKPSSEIDRSVGRKILQSRASLLRTMLMSSNGSLDFMKAVAYSEREYARYRGKFLQALKQMAQQFSVADTTFTLNRIMTQLKSAKTLDFPFSNTGMGGGEWFIPATSAYMGITPLWDVNAQPFVVETNSKGVEILYVRGHDGSLTPGFSRGDSTNPVNTLTNFDDRDLVLIAFEQMIYNSAKDSLKTQRRTQFDILAATPGKFRASDYSREEFLDVARPLFERWVATSGLNYRENKIYNETNPFTWNYGGLLDRDGEEVPGHWRGIYKWFFDTDRPHQSPWEMLGYVNKPTWWSTYYDWIDATKRLALVQAITIGQISEPGSALELDTKYARPGFENVVPVGLDGSLLDPISAGIVVDARVSNRGADWKFGDSAPVENSWWNGANIGFTWAQIGYLMKPGRFIEGNWRTNGEELIHGQWIRTLTGNRSVNRKSPVHNELLENGTRIRVLGVQTWLSDFIRSQGQDIKTTLGERIRSLNVNLAHKLGGFIDPLSLKTFTENSGILPQEDVRVALYRSPSVREEFYGGVVIERTDRGWRVIGYDVLSPSFKIKPVTPTGNRSIITLIDVIDTSVDWHGNTYYTVGVLTTWNGTNYRCKKTHTSATKFEQEYWQAESVGRQSSSDRVTWFLDHEHDDYTQTIPYGTEFYSRQDVAEFLSGYQAYLESRGWKFDQYDIEINAPRDFKYSTREFLLWTQTDWETGTFIALSPSADNVKFTSDHGTVQNIEQLVNGVYSIVDRSGMAIAKNDVTANRTDDAIQVGTIGEGIFGLRLFVSEVEQALVFNNRTIFNDVIYDPLFDLRQTRIRVSANLSTEWKGRLDAPGFIITDNRLVPSFDTQVEDIRHMYDIEKAINLPLRDHARHQIGYQARPYLDNLMYNEVNQFEFYQGMIQQKGAPGVFSKLLRNNELTQTRSLNFLEEWAFRKGVYGGIDQDYTFEFLLAKDSLRSDPQMVVGANFSPYDLFLWDSNLWDKATAREMQLLENRADKAITLSQDVGAYDPRWLVPAPDAGMFPVGNTYIREKGSLPTAGYARITDTDYQALNFSQMRDNIASSNVDLEIRDRLWIYDVGNGRTWDIFAVTNSTPLASEILEFKVDAATYGRLQFTMDGLVAAVPGDYVYINKVIDGDTELNGFHKVVSVSGNTFTIDAVTLADKEYDPTEEKPQAFLLCSVRVSNQLSIDDIQLLPLVFDSRISWENGDLVYVDNAYEYSEQHQLVETKQRWAVYARDGGAFVKVRTQPKTVRSGAIKDIKLFETHAIRTARSLNAKPLLNSDITVWDPVQGMVPGLAQKEITYKLNYDPANYNVGPATDVAGGLDWGKGEVGRLWWDLSTTFYLQANTNETLDTIELSYRQTNWGKLAPGASVDIYEWVKSGITPAEWQAEFLKGEQPHKYDGEVLNSENPNYVESVEWDSRLNRSVPVYFFWVKNRKNTPNVPFRRLDANTVSLMLSNPSSQGLAWVAPLSEKQMILSNVAQYLTASSSMQFTVGRTTSEVKKHVEWQIMRASDERSLPDVDLWNKLVTSLTAKDVWSNPIPNPARYYTDQIGYDVEHGQNIFRDVRAARKHVVRFLNKLMAQSPVVDERLALGDLTTTELSNAALQWAQVDGSFYVKPIPHNSLWGGSLKGNLPQGNDLQLVYGTTQNQQFWSVMKDGELIDAYQVKVQTIADLNSPAIINNLPSSGDGLMVMVEDTYSSGFWSIWEGLNTGNGPKFSLKQLQRYDSQDCWGYIDWYADGFTSDKEPGIAFATARERDDTLGSNPYMTLVKVLDDGNGRWMWTEYQDGQWIVVAKQNATIQVSDSIWETTGNLLNVTGVTPEELAIMGVPLLVAQRDRGFELNYMLNVFREKILSGLEQNQFFFSLVNYAHTEQDFIDWCFKTSFMYVTGYSDRLRKDPVAYADLTTNLLEYIKEVKPYHVKVRDFISKYRTTDDMVKVRVSDFDLPVVVDLKTGKTRTLDPDVAEDAVILSQGKYVAWWDKAIPLHMMTKNGTAPSIVNPLVAASPIRKLNITQQYQDAVNVSVDETLWIEVTRRNLSNITHNAYDIGSVETPYPLDAYGQVDYQSLTFGDTATNWDLEQFDHQFVSDNQEYAQRSLIVERSDIYNGDICANPYGTVNFWGQEMPTVLWDWASDSYSSGSTRDSWFDVVEASGLAYGYQLANPRVIGMKLVAGEFTNDQMILHVQPNSNILYRLVVKNSTATNPELVTDAQFVSTLPAAPLDLPL